MSSTGQIFVQDKTSLQEEFTANKKWPVEESGIHNIAARIIRSTAKAFIIGKSVSLQLHLF